VARLNVAPVTSRDWRTNHNSVKQARRLYSNNGLVWIFINRTFVCHESWLYAGCHGPMQCLALSSPVGARHSRCGDIVCLSASPTPMGCNCTYVWWMTLTCPILTPLNISTGFSKKLFQNAAIYFSNQLCAVGIRACAKTICRRAKTAPKTTLFAILQNNNILHKC